MATLCLRDRKILGPAFKSKCTLMTLDSNSILVTLISECILVALDWRWILVALDSRCSIQDVLLWPVFSKGLVWRLAHMQLRYPGFLCHRLLVIPQKFMAILSLWEGRDLCLFQKNRTTLVFCIEICQPFVSLRGWITWGKNLNSVGRLPIWWVHTAELSSDFSPLCDVRVGPWILSEWSPSPDRSVDLSLRKWSDFCAL